jgi:hypothetical protein
MTGVPCGDSFVFKKIKKLDIVSSIFQGLYMETFFASLILGLYIIKNKELYYKLPEEVTTKEN